MHRALTNDTMITIVGVNPHGREGEDMETQAQSTLYDRLGGVYNIAVVIDDLIDRVMTDARLNANPRVDEAHHRVSPAGFKYYVTELLCEAAGGPQKDEVTAIVESTKEAIVIEPLQEGPVEVS